MEEQCEQESQSSTAGVSCSLQVNSGLDFTPPSREREVPDDAPIVVVLHGLTGGS